MKEKEEYTGEKFRKDKEFKRLLRDMAIENGPLCKRCGRQLSAANPFILVTKKFPEDGGDWKDKDNFKVQCRMCHWEAP